MYSQARVSGKTSRFGSLLEKLYEDSVVPSSGNPLMSLSREPLQTLIQRQRLDKVIALSTQGTDRPLETVANELPLSERPAVLIGGFPEGNFSQQTTRLTSQMYRIDKRRLEAWTVVSRTIYDYEKSVGLRRF